jgi:hypothetical protein
MAEELVVYWSPANFTVTEESWNLLYLEPELVNNKLREMSTGYARSIKACPASKFYLNNLFSLKIPFSDEITLPVDFLNLTHMDEGEAFLDTKSILAIKRVRPSSYVGYSNLSYNLGWLFFCEEPLVARLTPPTIPPTSPAEGAILSSGEFDVGQWFRPILIDYHIPLTTQSLSFKENDDIAYIKFETSKKVVLKRFLLKETLNNIMSESVFSPVRYGKFKTLSERYEMARRTKVLNIISSEIKKNLVE